MGFFSWLTNDTNESIANQFSGKKVFTVYMKDNKGNVWQENNYEGYGEFGGKDFYVLTAQMNGLTGDEKELRDRGITLAFSDDKHLQPCLFRDKERQWEDKHPEICPWQGSFYEEEENV